MDKPQRPQQTRVVLTLSSFCYDELARLSELTDTQMSKLAAAPVEQWIQSPEFAELLKRARDRAKEQAK